MVYVARRLDGSQRRRRRALAVAVAGVLVLAALTAAVDYFILYRGSPIRPPIFGYAMVSVRQHLLPWIALAGVLAVIEARRRATRGAFEHERLRAEVAEQRLIALTGQLHPHFLFNTLQSISTLIYRDPDAADAMLTKLADLLRDLLRQRDRVLVPLGDETRYARTYLEIAKARFGDRLTFCIDVPEHLATIPVPLFIVQPLVENALSHGIGQRIEGGTIWLTARRAGDSVTIEVADDGAGLAPGSSVREGIGLGNTRERLRASFGDGQRLTIERRQSGGTVARIELPWTKTSLAGAVA
jgi:LytS/YehU family sensor histidine kinase